MAKSAGDMTLRLTCLYSPRDLLSLTKGQAQFRTKVTKGAGSRKAGLQMAFKLIEAAQQRWRKVQSSQLVALVRAGVKFEDGKMIESNREVAA